jgi:hypothetical protein
MDSIISRNNKFELIKQSFYAENMRTVVRIIVMNDLKPEDSHNARMYGFCVCDNYTCLCCHRDDSDVIIKHNNSITFICEQCNEDIPEAKSKFIEGVIKMRLLIANLPLLDDINGLINDIYLDVLRV